jgi:hypothetical protein
MLCNLSIAVPNFIRVIRLSDVGRSDVSSVAWPQWRGGDRYLLILSLFCLSLCCDASKGQRRHTNHDHFYLPRKKSLRYIFYEITICNSAVRMITCFSNKLAGGMKRNRD